MRYARPRFNIEIDWIGGVLIALMLTIQGISLYIINMLNSTAPEATPTQQSNPALPIGILVFMAVEIAILLVLFRYYKRLSEWWQWVARLIFKGMVYMLGLTMFTHLGIPFVYIVAVPVAYLLYRFTRNSPYKWLAFNLIAVVGAIYTSATLAHWVAPIVILPLLVVGIVYDYFAVSLSDIMGDLVEFSSTAKIPNFIIIPTQLRVDLDGLFAYMQGESDEIPDAIGSVIGVGDFFWPSIFVGSIFINQDYAFTAPVLGTILGTIVAFPLLRGALEQSDGALPALPWLNTGAIGGYAIGLVVALAA